MTQMYLSSLSILSIEHEEDSKTDIRKVVKMLLIKKEN